MKQISPETKQQILEDLAQGYSIAEVAEKYGVGTATVSRYKKENPLPPIDTQSAIGDNQAFVNLDYTTTDTLLSSETEQVILDKMVLEQLFDVAEDEKNAKYLELFNAWKIPPDLDKQKARHFTFVVYEESAPPDWKERLNNTGLPWSRSPKHDKDDNPDGSKKKSHWHIIVSWENPTTFRSARELCKLLRCARPQILKSVLGMYRYFNHKDNPEKYQYEELPEHFNGWDVPITNEEIEKLKSEILKIVLLEDCAEYAELVIQCELTSPRYAEVVKNHTVLFNHFVTSYRHSPVRVLSRSMPWFDKPEEQTRILELLQHYGQQDDEDFPENNNNEIKKEVNQDESNN